MPTALSPVAIWRDALSRPNPGELASIASLLLFLDELCDRSQYNYEHHFRGNVSATRFGYVGSGAVNDYPAIRAAGDAAIAAGGGTVWVPAGTSARLDTELVADGRWHLKAMKGLSGTAPTRLIRNHTGRLIKLDNATFVSPETPMVLEGFKCEDAAAASNPMIDVQDGSMLLRHCWLNGVGAFTGGPLLRMASGHAVHLEQSVIWPNTSTNAITMASSGLISAGPGNRFITPVTYSARFIDLVSVSAFDPSLLAFAGVEFDAHQTVGGAVEWIHCAGSYWSVSASGCIFRADGVFPTAFAWDAGGERRLNVDASNSFDTHVRYSGADTLGNGSSLALDPYGDVSISGLTVLVPPGVESYAIRSTHSVAPNVTTPQKLFNGQRLRLTIRNSSGGDWVTAPALSGTVSVTGASLPFLANGQSVCIELEVSDLFGDGTFSWLITRAA